MIMNMKMRGIALVLVAASLFAAPAAAADYFLYTPERAEEGKIPAGETGVLVKEITIKWGDTLYGLSRQHAGRGTYYPQILLFNNIKDPDLIYAGKKLRVPIKHAEAATAEQVPAPAKKAVRKEKPVAKEKEEETFVPPAMPRTPRQPEKSLPPPVVSPSPQTSAAQPKAQPSPQAEQRQPSAAQDEQKLYRQGILLFKQGDYKAALAEFDEFLAKFPNSDLAADVTLYRAESLLKLASQ